MSGWRKGIGHQWQRLADLVKIINKDMWLTEKKLEETRKVKKEKLGDLT